MQILDINSFGGAVLRCMSQNGRGALRHHPFNAPPSGPGRLSWASQRCACLAFCFVAGSCRKTVGHFSGTRLARRCWIILPITRHWTEFSFSRWTVSLASVNHGFWTIDRSLL
jgi:hypothetical protein